MNETSKGRRLTGKLAILSAAAIALPLTATVVPVFAEDAPAAADTDKKIELKARKIVIVKSQDGKPVVVDTQGDADAPFVRTIEKDGKTIVLRTSKELSEAEVEKMVAAAEASRAEAEAMAAEGEKKTMVIRMKKDGSLAEGQGADYGKFSFDAIEIPKMIPDIDIQEIRGKCDEGEPVSTDVQGFDGQNKSRVRIVMCGKGQAKVARQHAIQGLKEARDEIKADADMPDGIRKDVVKKLDEKIRDMEKQIKKDASENADA